MEGKLHVCASCRREMPPPSDSPAARPVTGEVCDECLSRVTGQTGISLGEFLDDLDAPVMLVDSDVTVMLANKLVRSILNKDISQIQGRRGGDVFECVYARLPGGCGRTIHCGGCAIRRAVTDTFLTGRGHAAVLATIHPDFGKSSRQVAIRISTEKIWNMVLLRLEQIGPAQEPLLPNKGH